MSVAAREPTAMGAMGAMRRWIGRGCLAGILCLTGMLLAPGSGQAELRRVEAVGIYGVRDAMRTKVIVRDKAVENALWEGVSRVALELVGDATRRLSRDAPADGSGPEEDGQSRQRNGQEAADETGGSNGIDSEALRAALGDGVIPYTRSFRILEDQGEQPVLFDEDPDTKTEYVVVVEVLVDVERVEAALEQAGWIAASGVPAAESKGRLELELLGLERYEALEALMTGLGEALGADRVQLLEASPARQVLAVEGRFDARELEAWLQRFRHPQLLLDSVAGAGEGARLRVRARWLPIAEEISLPSGRAPAEPRAERGWGDPASLRGGSREVPARI